MPALISGPGAVETAHADPPRQTRKKTGSGIFSCPSPETLHGKWSSDHTLHLANLPNFALDRLTRYEASLWCQVSRILFALDRLDRRKPQERKRGRDLSFRW
jgi:hypothetical protein